MLSKHSGHTFYSERPVGPIRPTKLLYPGHHMSSFLSSLDKSPNDPMDISFILYPVP